MKFKEIFVFSFLFLFKFSEQLPVQKSSTQKPEEAKDSGDSPVLENVIEYER